MEEIIDDYIYIKFTNFDILKKDCSKVFEKLNNSDYTLVERIDENKKTLQSDLLCLNLIKNNEICIPISIHLFIKNINKGYPDKKIWGQFLNDIDRSQCYFNNNLINLENADFFKNYLESKFSQEKIDNILMLCTQAVLAYPFEIIQNSLVNRYLSEIPIKTDNEILKIFIYNNSDEIIFNIQKRMRIFKLNQNYNDVTTEYINIQLDFNIDCDEYVLMKIKLEK